MTLGYKELPFIEDEKRNFLRSHFKEASDSTIGILAKNKSLRFIVMQPTFVYYYIEDNQIQSKFVSCGQFIQIPNKSPIPEAFAIYQITEDLYVYSPSFRGAYVRYDGQRLMEDRDKKIEELLSDE